MAEMTANRVFNRPGVVVEGWYWVLRAGDLKRGRTAAVTVMGRDLVAYRTQPGRPVLMDAYCPHMGCHLALGRVEGDCLRCFFHNWSFGPDGSCVDVPSMARPPRQARCRVWPAREKYGLIWVWTGAGEPEHEVPENPELQETGCDFVLGKPRRKRCHPNVMMINAIDEQHFRTVHGVPGELLQMEPAVRSDRNIRFANSARVPRHNAWFRFLARFYRGPLRYELSYWYGSNGFVTMGPDFLHLYLLFALRESGDGGSESQTVAMTRRRPGLWGWVINRVVLLTTRLAGDYFSVGDTRVFQSIRFDYRTPVAADRAVQAFIRHLDGQPLAEWLERPQRPEELNKPEQEDNA